MRFIQRGMGGPMLSSVASFRKDKKLDEKSNKICDYLIENGAK